MSVAIERFFEDTAVVTIDTTGGGTSTEIPCEGFSTGTIFVLSGTVVTLTFTAARISAKNQPSAPGQTAPAIAYYGVYDAANLQISRTVAVGRCYLIPPEVMATGAFKIIGNATGTAEICLKA